MEKNRKESDMIRAKRVKDWRGLQWVTCGKCGHKLMRIVPIGPVRVFPMSPEFEIKCSSCKELNKIQVDKFLW